MSDASTFQGEALRHLQPPDHRPAIRVGTSPWPRRPAPDPVIGRRAAHDLAAQISPARNAGCDNPQVSAPAEGQSDSSAAIIGGFRATPAAMDGAMCGSPLTLCRRGCGRWG